MGGGLHLHLSLINTLGRSTHLQVGSSVKSASQFLRQSVSQSVRQSPRLLWFYSQFLTTTRHAATPLVSWTPAVWAVTTFFLSFVLLPVPLCLLRARTSHLNPTDPACRPPARPSAVPFFLQHPSNIYNDFGAAWPRLLELYILSAEPEPLLSSSFVRVPHDTTLGSLLNR